MANVSTKSRLVASILCVCLGYLGVDLFYKGKIIAGLLQIIASCCIVGEVIWVIRSITTLLGLSKDKHGNRVSAWIVKN